MYFKEMPKLTPEEILDYLRKSQSDDPLLTVEEVLEKHEKLLDEWDDRHLNSRVPEHNRFREVVSGETIKERPEINKVLRLIESPKYKAVKIVEPQRLTRGDLEDIGRVMKLFKHTNTLIICPDRVYDLRDEYDWNAFEAELKRGNDYLNYFKKIQARGRLLSVQSGNFIGNNAPYGYEKTTVMDGKRKCPTLKIKEDEAVAVRMIFDMYVNQDMGRVNIAHRLNELGFKPRKGGLWAQDSIKIILENDHYIGKVRWNWKKTMYIVEDGEIKKVRPRQKVGEYLVFDGKHPAIVSEEIFMAAREKKGRNHRAKPKTKVRNPLAGLLFCQCGRAMSMRTYKYNGAAPRLLCDNQTYCKTTSCLYEEIIDRVIEVLKQCIDDFQMRIDNDNKDARAMHKDLLKRLETKLEELNRKEIAQWEKYTEEGMPKEIFDKLNEKVLHDKEEIQQALCTAKDSMPEPIDYVEKQMRFKDALEALKDPNVPAERKNTLLKACIERIDYHREKAERIPGQRVRKYDPEKKKTVSRSPLKTGANWTNPPIELDFKLKI